MTEETFDMGAPDAGFDPLDPANMSPLVVALCADEAQSITGQVFHVWGGAINALQGWTSGELFAARRALGRRRAPRRAARTLPRRRRAGRDDRRDASGGRSLASHAGVTAPARRRIYLLRHAQVRYFQGEHPHEVVLTEEGRAQAAAAAAALRDVRFDRVITSGLPRTLETAGAIAPGVEPERNHELREIESGELRGLAPEIIQEMMTAAFRGVVPLETQFLGGETIGELFDRVLPALDALLADGSWDVALLVLHGAVNRAILSRALTGRRTFLGAFEQAPACINVLDVDREANFIVRAVGYTPYDPVSVHAARQTTMEELWQEYLDSRREKP